MVDPIPDLAGVRGFRFTGADQLFKVPPKITTVWLSGVGGSGAAFTRQFGEWEPRGIANVPLAVEPGDHIRVRVGGRPEIVGRYPDGEVDFEWKLSEVGGWNGGGNGGGTWGRDPIGSPGTLHACGGGGATTFHHIPKGQNPVAVDGELVAVAPGAAGTVRGFLGALGIAYYAVGSPYDLVVVEPYGSGTPGSSFSFSGEPVPGIDAPEFLGSMGVIAAPPPPVTTPRTPTWLVLDEPVDLFGGDGPPGTGDFTFDSAPDVSLGNPGETFKGGAGLRFADAAATPGGGGGYGGGASGSRLVGDGEAVTLGAATLDLAMGARHGGFLLPIERPAGWDDGAVMAAGSTLTTVEVEGVEADVLLLPLGDGEDPFGVYDFTTADIDGEDPTTMLGHGSARIQWNGPAKRAKWRVGHVGWGRNNGW